MRSRQTIVAVACLTLGAAEVAYLNLEVAPALVEAESGPRASGLGPQVRAPDQKPEAPSPMPAASAPVLTAVAPRPEARGPRPATAGPRPGAVRIAFGRDDATLGERANDQLAQIAEQLAAEPSLAAVIEGHTDRLGEPAHNDLLSQHRAEAVADQLVGLGVARERLTVRWFGEHQPLADSDADGADRRNRRVEVQLAAGSGDTP